MAKGTVLIGFEIENGIYYPIVEAHSTSRGVQLTFWCDFCKTDHFHGRCAGHSDCKFDIHSARNPDGCSCPKGSGDGHRVAHCQDDSSGFYKTGYVLREV